MQTTLDTVTEFESLQRVVLATARVVTGAAGATLVLRDGDKCFYVDEDSIAPLWKGQRFPMTACISGWAMLNRESAVVADIEVDERIPLAAYRPTFVRSLAMVPLGTEEPVGAIGAYWSSARRIDPGVVSNLEQLADEVALAVDRIGLDKAPWAPSFAD
jgi:two-component system CheB/CheR fusion protein